MTIDRLLPLAKCFQALRNPLLRGDRFLHVIRHWNIKFYTENIVWPREEAELLYSLRGEEEVKLLYEVLDESTPEERLAIEKDLFLAFLIDNSLLHCRKLLHYLNFVAWDVYSGVRLPSLRERDILVTDINEVPCALAATLCETQQKVAILKPGRFIIDHLSQEAQEYSWWKVESPGKIKRLELWELPWPVLGVPEGADDITEANVWFFFNIVYDAIGLHMRIAKEFENWNKVMQHVERVTDRMNGGEERERFLAMLSKTHEFLLALLLETADF